MATVTMKDKTKYRNIMTGDIYTLSKDYNSRWFLSLRNERGLTKTLSYSKIEMENILREHYEKAK
ncbi:hypothetical protein H7K20_16595 [Priestia aryabhattai]|uniref:Integrase n=1 Tax=Priestia aryabhattai TaxID=412384 RepID=A0ABD7X323_PRIAR|nr:hypothetical protein [Priestia aryabhattai]MBY0028722.1 hypothetical protein [Priestia aryabhattai]WEA46753.1 hypothetical protein PWO00_12560 [Priestia aryabhattai]